MARTVPPLPAAALPASTTADDDGIIRLPAVRALVRQVSGHLLEGVLVPAITFYAVLATVSLRWALIATLLWSYSVIGFRLSRRRRVPGILVLGAGIVTARTAIAFATNSSFVYLVQPSLANFCVALLFLASLVPGKPLTRRLADDFCAFPARSTATRTSSASSPG